MMICGLALGDAGVHAEERERNRLPIFLAAFRRQVRSKLVRVACPAL